MHTMPEGGPVLYVHGMGGSAAECRRFQPLLPGRAVVGLDYQTFTPWETGPEIRAAVEKLQREKGPVTLIANSIGAYFSMHAGIGGMIRKAFFISPVVDMERLIRGMMDRAGVTEEELKTKGELCTALGEKLSWNYLCYVRAHPIRWGADTEILYGKRDELIPYETVAAFAKSCGACLTVMETGGHWFHTEEELQFLDAWITGCADRSPDFG